MEASGFRFVGFDCAEEEHSVVLLNEDGETELQRKVVNRRDRVEEALAELVLAIPEDLELVVVFESERSHGRVVADVARGLGVAIWKVNTVALNHFRDVEGQPRKDDDWDAYLAARMAYLRTKGCREVVEVSDEERALSKLSRSHASVTDDRVQFTLRLRAVLLELAPEIVGRSWQGPKIGSMAMELLLKRWPGFEGKEKARLLSIEKILRRCRYGARASDVAKDLRDMARRITFEKQERSAMTQEIEYLLRQIEVCNTTLESFKAEIAARVEPHPIGKKLLEMPGIGIIIAAVLLSELLPVSRTTTEAKSATYSGVTPLNRKTGKMPNRPRLARGTNKRILRALYLSSVASLRCSAIDKAYFTKKTQDYAGHPKPHVAAFIALSRQRHKVIFKLLTTEARYDKEKLFARHLERLEQNRGATA